MIEKYLKKSEVYEMDLDSIGNITDFVRQCLKDWKIESAETTKAVLVTEEAAGSLLMHGSGDGELRVSVRGLLSAVRWIPGFWSR